MFTHNEQLLKMVWATQNTVEEKQKKKKRRKGKIKQV